MLHFLPRPLLALAAGTCVLALASCGDDGGSDTASGEPSSTTAGFPRTIEHKFGSTEIPAQPTRVVTAGYTEQDTVLALGVTPVATREFLGGYDWRPRPWAQEALGGKELETVGQEELDVEGVAAQRPDLIVALNTGQTEEDYERLSRIAPTLAQEGDVVDFGMSWQDQTEMIGEALGREDRADEVIERVEAKFEEAREAHPEFEGKSAVLAYGGPDGFGAYTSQDTRSRFLRDLGFEFPEEIDEAAGDAFYTELSNEQFRLLDRDLVVYFGTKESVEDSPALRRLDAYREDRIVYLDLSDQFAGALGFSSPLSLPYLVDMATPMFSAAVDGDPATAISQPE